jgi:hypothetical protein
MTAVPRETIRYHIGLDLGQSVDYTAIAVVRRVLIETKDERLNWAAESERIECGHLERCPLHTPYPLIVNRVRMLMQHPICAGNVTLTIDQTGVGGAVADLFRQKGIEFHGVVITGGKTETNPSPGTYHVPKLNLISAVQALLHQGSLRIRADLPDTKTLVDELQDFRVEFTASGSMTFGARSGRHDDLVLALTIAIWRAMRPSTGPEAWLEYYRRLTEKTIVERTSDRVCVQVPATLHISTVYGISGKAYGVEVSSDSRRIVMMSPDDARALVCSPFPSSTWREANPEF